MKRLMMLFLFLISGHIVSAQSSYNNTQVQILPESKLTISGDTNINEFECEFNTAHLDENTNLRYKVNKSNIIFENAILNLNNKGFDCGNRGINKDFRELIKSDRYPEITLCLKEIDLKDPKLALAKVTICIAGIEKKYQVPVEISKDKIPHFKGKIHLNIRDFKLEPPKKALGLIVVKEEIEVKFNLSVVE